MRTKFIVMEPFFLLPLLLFIISFTCLSIHNFITKHKPQLALNNYSNGLKVPLPHGATGWPIFGESLDYFSKISNGVIEKFVAERREKYSSKVFKTSLIGHPMAILCGPEGNKFIFSNEKKLVQVWLPSSLKRTLTKSSNVVHNDHFLKVRKMLPSLLKANALQNYVGIMDAVIKHHLQTDWVGEKVEVIHVVRKYILTLSCRLFLSIDDPKKVDEFLKPMKNIENGILALPVDLPGTAFSGAMKGSKVLHDEIEAIIKQRKIDLSEKRASPKQDMLSQMLITTDENGQFLDELDISSHILGLLIGGYSTLIATLTFIMKYLAELPQVYYEVLREQTDIVTSQESKDSLTWEDTKKMRYSWNVVNEVLRLMPPDIGTFREAITDFTYAGYLIPKGWKLHTLIGATHKNANYFPDPEKFDPSRFEGKGPAPYTFIPFGGGPRMCPGNEYARLAILVFMHNVVTTFKWEKLIPDEKVLHKPLPVPAHGLPVRLHHHKQRGGL